jgi:hypothetical protein
MTDRERWTVYPLLFLALGISVKDKLEKEKKINVDQVRCNSLVVTDRGSGKDRVTIGSSPAGGIMQVQGDHDVRSILLGYYNTVAGLMYVDAQGNPRPLMALPTDVPHRQPANSSGEPQVHAAKDQPSEPARQPREQTPESEPPPDEAK